MIKIIMHIYESGQQKVKKKEDGQWVSLVKGENNLDRKVGTP